MKKLIIMSITFIALTCTISTINAKDVTATPRTVRYDTFTLNDLKLEIPVGFTEVQNDKTTHCEDVKIILEQERIHENHQTSEIDMMEKWI